MKTLVSTKNYRSSLKLLKFNLLQEILGRTDLNLLLW